MASRLPRTSALTTSLSSRFSPSPKPANMLSNFAACCMVWRCSRVLSRRNSANSRAERSSVTTEKSSPAPGVPVRPSTSTGCDGPALAAWRPWSSSMVRTRPWCSPAMTTSPRRRVPFCTSMVETGPRPRSKRDSTTTPRAGASGIALSSRISACSSTASSKVGMPSPVTAETSANRASPPHSSAMTWFAANSLVTCFASAPSRSILLMATTMGTSAAWACWMASTVCGLTPSSAATTKITMSVTRAPLARMAVKAAWPGVSMKQMRPYSVSTE